MSNKTLNFCSSLPFEFGKVDQVKKAAVEAIEKYGLNSDVHVH